MKIKEYAAFGLPIVMTNVPEIADEVEGEGVGIIVDYDPRQLAQAVVRILTDARLYSKMSERAVRFASGYDWSSIFARALQQTLETTNPVPNETVNSSTGSVHTVKLTIDGWSTPRQVADY
jgi:glycosyltransferase involved in cell wall biosynthesis